MMSQTQTFGYGSDMSPNENGVQCPCPAAAAGYSPAFGDISMGPAEQYDEIVRGITDDRAGTISWDTARQAWDETILILQRRVEESNDLTELRQERAEAELEAARDVAAELGWR